MLWEIVCVHHRIFYMLCHYLNISFSFSSDMKSLRVLTRNKHTHHLIFLLLIAWRTHVSAWKRPMARAVLTRVLLPPREAQRTAVCFSATVSNQPLNLNRLVRYWCGWKCEATRDELRPAVGLPWYFHRGNDLHQEDRVDIKSRRLICGDETRTLEKDNVEPGWNGVRPALWNIILSFFSLPNKETDVV